MKKKKTRRTIAVTGVSTETDLNEVWMPTFSGGKFHIFNPQIDELRIEDIAHALSQKCRYNGMTRLFYSVAEHSVCVARLVYNSLGEDIDQKINLRACLWGLLHDAPEAYIGDWTRPMLARQDLRSIVKGLDKKIMDVVVKKYFPDGSMEGVPANCFALDDEIIHAEVHCLFPEHTPIGKYQVPQRGIVSNRAFGWEPQYAKRRFLEFAWFCGIEVPERFKPSQTIK